MTQVTEIIQDYPTKNDKRERKQNAQMLPPGITQNMMKKYVVYYREMMKLKTGKEQQREYFKVESHPKLDKPWVTSKSVKISLIDKLNEANQFVEDLENTNDSNDLNDTNDANTPVYNRLVKHLPKYTMIRVVTTTPTITSITMVYDRKDKTNGVRWTSSHTYTCPTSQLSGDESVEKTVISLGIQHLRNKIREKYGADLWGL